MVLRQHRAYEIFHCKEHRTIEVKVLRTIFKVDAEDKLKNVDWFNHNDHFIFAKNIKVAREVAMNIKNEWVKEVEAELAKLKKINF
jgi:hypothetical protein